MKKSNYFSQLMQNNTIVKVTFHLPGSLSSHYFKGIIESIKDDVLIFYDDRTDKTISVKTNDIITVYAPKNQLLHPDNIGLKSMRRKGKADKRSYHQKFSYSKWWKNENIQEVD